MNKEDLIMAQLDKKWVDRWAQKVNEDKVLEVIGNYCTANFVLGIDGTDYVIKVEGGKIKKVDSFNTFNMIGGQFALRGPSSSWSKFAETYPPPRFNDLFALALHGHITIDGDTKVLMQNARAIMWMFDDMRKV